MTAAELSAALFAGAQHLLSHSLNVQAQVFGTAAMHMAAALDPDGRAAAYLGPRVGKP